MEFGDPAGRPVFYAHGGPGSHVEGKLFHEVALCRKYRFIATDRPGMGESTYLADRKLLDYPRDIAELADALGIDKFGVMGWSGGGAHTTVCAYAIPERLLFNLTFAGYTNFAEMPGAEKYLESKMDQVAVGLSKKHPLIRGIQ
jgi:pimeloyl-ACP methyl ester carboxylesterase